MIPPTGQRSPSLWVGGLFIISVLALLFAAGLEFEGLGRARKEHIESQEWPAVAATVDTCYLDRYYPFRKDGGGVVYSVQCRFSYSINGIAYKSRTEAPGNHHSLQNPAQLPQDALRMQAWATRHKKGSTQVIHYDPANPAKISLAGADDEIRSNTAAIALSSARQPALSELVCCWLLSLHGGSAWDGRNPSTFFTPPGNDSEARVSAAVLTTRPSQSRIRPHQGEELP